MFYVKEFSSHYAYCRWILTHPFDIVMSRCKMPYKTLTIVFKKGATKHGY